MSKDHEPPEEAQQPTVSTFETVRMDAGDYIFINTHQDSDTKPLPLPRFTAQVAGPYCIGGVDVTKIR